MSDDGLEGLRVGPRPERKRSAVGGALRGVALALLGSLLFGFAVGLWLRCRLERPNAPYLGAAPAPPLSPPPSATQASSAPDAMR